MKPERMGDRRCKAAEETRWKVLWVPILTATALLFAAGCSVLGSPSKVRAGQLYAPGSARYDAYFGEVHAQQVAQANWPDDRKSTRKPLVDVLKLLPDADDGSIVQATKDRLSSGILRLDVQGTDVHVVEAAAAHHDSPRDVLAAVEVTAHGEIERAKKLSDLPPRIEALAKTGRELEDHIAQDFAGNGQKPFEVREELRASYDVLLSLSQSVERERKTADQFVADLGRAVSTGSEVPAGAPPPVLPKTKPTKGTPASKPEVATKPAPVARIEPVAPAPRPAPVARAEPPVAPAPKPAPAPPPPKPAAKSADTEVFNP